MSMGAAAAIAAVVIVIAANGRPPDDMRAGLVSADKPTELCLPLDPETRKAVRERASQVVLIVKSYQPPVRGQADIKVSLAKSGNDGGHDLTVIGMFPGGPFEAEVESEARRFYVPLSGVMGSLSTMEELCLDISFAPSTEPTEGASAKVEVEFAPAP